MSLYNRILYALQLISHSRVYSRTLFALLNYLHIFYVWFGNVIDVRDLDYNIQTTGTATLPFLNSIFYRFVKQL